MAKHEISRPAGAILYQFQVLEAFTLMVPQANGSEIEQPYSVGNIYHVREGNTWLDGQVNAPGGLLDQGKVEVI